MLNIDLIFNAVYIVSFISSVSVPSHRASSIDRVDHIPVFNVFNLFGTCSPGIDDKSRHVINKSAVFNQGRTPILRRTAEMGYSLENTKCIFDISRIGSYYEKYENGIS